MVKFIIGIALVGVSTVLGKRLTVKHLYRLKYYECLSRFNLHLKQNLLHKKEDLLELLRFKCDNEDFSATLTSLKLNVTLENDASELYFPYWADGDDRAFLSNYFNSLGENNLQAEMENIVIQENLINDKVLKIADKSSKFSNLGQRLGFSVGMVVFIIIL